MTDTTPRRRHPVARELARRWPALAGAAVVTALVPAGVALASFGPSIFQSFDVTAVSATTEIGLNPAVFASGSGTGTGLKATANTGVEAIGTGGPGVKASSASGAGVDATSTSGAGVKATGGGNGVIAQGGSTGVTAQGASFGVVAVATGATGTAVNAVGQGHGVVAGGAVGGQFSGSQAPIRLVPAASLGAPTAGTHEIGELYVDSKGQLFICTGAGSPGVWSLVGLQSRASETP